MGGSDGIDRRSLMREIRARHPGFREAVLADAAATALHRDERHVFHGRLDALLQILRLTWRADAFAAQVVYRLRARLLALGVPFVPQILHRLAVALCQVPIVEPVVIQPGLYLLHGQVVIDGITEIGRGATIAPFVTVGLREGNIVGPKIADGVEVGSGAKVLGAIRVGPGARVGANAVVVDDVPAETTVVGVPARPVSRDPNLV
jgi:serine O-acetyltransferase